MTDLATQYAKRRDALGMDPNEFERELREELHAQLCCAWEELAEQHHELDEFDAKGRPVLNAIKEIRFDEDHIVVIGKDRKISHFKFNLERLS